MRSEEHTITVGVGRQLTRTVRVATAAEAPVVATDEYHDIDTGRTGLVTWRYLPEDGRFLEYDTSGHNIDPDTDDDPQGPWTVTTYPGQEDRLLDQLVWVDGFPYRLLPARHVPMIQVCWNGETCLTWEDKDWLLNVECVPVWETAYLRALGERLGERLQLPQVRSTQGLPSYPLRDLDQVVRRLTALRRLHEADLEDLSHGVFCIAFNVEADDLREIAADPQRSQKVRQAAADALAEVDHDED